MPWSTDSKNAVLDLLTLDRIRLHSGDPGPDGLSNALGAGLSAATFNAASGGSRALDSNVTVTGLAANQLVTHFSVWKNVGTVFHGSGEITEGDTHANSSGEFILVATGTSFRIDDPA